MISENYFFIKRLFLKIALLSDIHDHPCPGLVASLKKNRPDIICVSGDFMLGFHPDSQKARKRMQQWRTKSGRRPGRALAGKRIWRGSLSGRPLARRPYAVEQIQYALRLLAACSKIAPTYVSLGNHEWMLTERELRFIERSTGVRILDNCWVRRGNLVIGGLTSAVVSEYRYYLKHPEAAADAQPYQSPGIFSIFQNKHNPVFTYRKIHEWVADAESQLPKIYPDRPYEPMTLRPRPDLNWLKDFERQDGFKLLLCHHPEYRDRYLKGRKIDLILAGHAHGGQIRILDQGLFAPGQGLLPRYTSGVHGNMVISRGLSNTASFIPRLGNPPEIVYLLQSFTGF